MSRGHGIFASKHSGHGTQVRSTAYGDLVTEI